MLYILPLLFVLGTYAEPTGSNTHTQIIDAPRWQYHQCLDDTIVQSDWWQEQAMTSARAVAASTFEDVDDKREEEYSPSQIIDELYANMYGEASDARKDADEMLGGKETSNALKPSQEGSTGSTREPRRHRNGQRYENDVQKMIRSLIYEHGITKNVAYKYVEQGMREGTIIELNDFKEKCIARWKRNQIIWGKQSASRNIRNQVITDHAKRRDEPMDDAYQCFLSNLYGDSQSDSYVADTTEASTSETQCVLMPQSSTSGSQEKVEYRVRSKTRNAWRFTNAGNDVMRQLQRLGMSRDTARRYLEKGIQTGAVDDLYRFKEDCLANYLKQTALLSRQGRPSKSGKAIEHIEREKVTPDCRETVASSSTCIDQIETDQKR